MLLTTLLFFLLFFFAVTQSHARTHTRTLARSHRPSSYPQTHTPVALIAGSEQENKKCKTGVLTRPYPGLKPPPRKGNISAYAVVSFCLPWAFQRQAHMLTPALVCGLV